MHTCDAEQTAREWIGPVERPMTPERAAWECRDAEEALIHDGTVVPLPAFLGQTAPSSASPEMVALLHRLSARSIRPHARIYRIAPGVLGAGAVVLARDLGYHGAPLIEVL